MRTLLLTGISTEVVFNDGLAKYFLVFNDGELRLPTTEEAAELALSVIAKDIDKQLEVEKDDPAGGSDVQAEDDTPVTPHEATFAVEEPITTGNVRAEDVPGQRFPTNGDYGRPPTYEDSTEESDETVDDGVGQF